MYAGHRVTSSVLGFGVLELVWALLFAVSYLVTRSGRTRVAGGS